MKENEPIRKLSLKFSRIIFVSISVPARKVRMIPPKVARYIIQSSVPNPRLPETAPSRISIMATDKPIRKEIKLAIRTNPPMINGM